MFQVHRISGSTGPKESPGFFEEVTIVRDGTEETVPLRRSVACAVQPHQIKAGEYAYILPNGILPGGHIVCTDHISSIITQKQLLKYQSFRAGLSSKIKPKG